VESASIRRWGRFSFNLRINAVEQAALEMNTITIVVAVLVLWLIMGLGFLTSYVDARRNGKTKTEAWKAYEGILFVASIALPVIIAVYRLFS